MLEELEDVLSRAWLKARLGDMLHRASDLLEAVTVLGTLVSGYVNVAGAVPDPFDEMFLACAKLGEADFVVTGDSQLLDVAEFATAEIVSPARFLKILVEGRS